MIILDTNVISELRRGPNAAPTVAAWFATLRPRHIFTSVIVLGELRRGEWQQRFARTLDELFAKRLAGHKRKGRRLDADASLATLKTIAR